MNKNNTYKVQYINNDLNFLMMSILCPGEVEAAGDYWVVFLLSCNDEHCPSFFSVA